VRETQVNFLFSSWLTVASEERKYVLTANFLKVRHRHYLVADTLIRDDVEVFIG
jgi:hypothetical protein